MDKNHSADTSIRPRLTQAGLGKRKAGIAVPAYDRGQTGLGIVHFGPGAFHRGHQACYVDTLLTQDPRWGICGAELKGAGLSGALIPQDYLYTVAELEVESQYRIVGAMKEYLTAERDAEAVFARLIDPAVRLVTITVTEKGYCLGANGLDTANPDIARDLSGGAAPSSLIGWVYEGLKRRRIAGLAPFIVMSCDNMVENGHKLRGAVLNFAEARGDKDFSAWIADQVRFPCTMVDSITPAANDALREKVFAATGLYDAAPVHRERFLQWVIEDVLGPDMPDFSAAGASLTHDVEAYELSKLRLLNGAHSTLAYAGLLRGHASVDAAMKDAKLGGFVERMMREDIAPSLRRVGGFDLSDYISAILTRFRNPALTHHLYQIASDGTQKLPYRILAVMQDALNAGRPLTRLAVPVAAWMRFVAREAKEGRAFNDPLTDRLSEIGKACTGVAADDLPRFFALPAVFPAELAKAPHFVSEVSAAYNRYGSEAFLPV
jgi:fructuronate reductase